MSESILTSVKKLLGIPAEDTDFDTDIIFHINSVFMILNQLGVGPDLPFKIVDDSTVWDDFDPTDMHRIMAVKSYVFLRVKLLFDPPSNSFVQTAMEQQIDEFTWRLTNQAERFM